MKILFIYTAKNCPFSKKLLAFLYDNELPFAEIKLEDDPAGTRKIFAGMKEIQTPVVAVDEGGNQVMTVGFTEQNKQRITDFYLEPLALGSN